MTLLIVVLGYFLGCIPTAYFAGRIHSRGDIRALGDGNSGAKNAYHQLGAKTGIMVFLVDMLKGGIAMLLAQAAHVSSVGLMLTGLAVMLGHVFPIFLGFRGGEGTASAIGIITVLLPQPMFILAVPCILTLLLKRNADLALAVLFVPLVPMALLMHKPLPVAIYCIVLPCLVAVIHFGRLFTKKASIA